MKVPEIEYASKKEIESFQEKKLAEVLEYVYNNSPFYKAHFERHGIQIAKIKKLSELVAIPTIGKKDLQAQLNKFYCLDRTKIIDYCSTSGTEGEAITIPLSENDLQRLAYNEAISFLCAGGSSEEVYQLTTTVDRRFMAGLAYISGARLLGAGMVRVGPGIAELQWKTIFEIAPTTLIIVPSFLLKLIEYAEAQGVDLEKASVKKAICIGESIRDENLNYNALAIRIKEKWDIHLFSTYASTEIATAFTECEMGNGGHFHPELVITEILDEQGNAVKAGEAGELTVTTLGVEAMPLVRFKTGDKCKKYEEKCACGRETYRIGPIIGRKSQMIKLKGTTLFPAAIFEVMDNRPEVINYIVEVTSDQYDNDQILIKYVAREGLNLKGLRDGLKGQLRVTPLLEEISLEELNLLMFPKLSRKPIKFIDKRNAPYKH